MTKLGIVGGKLQGIEATYLAKKAGYETVVFDRNPSAPALSLSDDVVVLDVVKEKKKALELFADCDAVLPANEDLETLTTLTHLFNELDVPLIFDMEAYQVSSSKLRSNEFMKRLGVPLPRPWPECNFPAVVKPSAESGSVGITYANNIVELEAGRKRIKEIGDEPVIQEFVRGPSISVEVIGDGSKAVPLVTTQIILDDMYDCKMVSSPWEDASDTVVDAISEAGRSMAMDLGLRGIMDVEAIVSNVVPRILEIDARLPSQTPTAVLHSHGINMVEMLVDMAVHDHLEELAFGAQRYAFYEHIAVDDGVMRSCGEALFAEVRNPRIVPGLFGADEMLTDYEPGKPHWRATIINTGSTSEQARTKRQKVLGKIIGSEDISQYFDPEPEGYF